MAETTVDVAPLSTPLEAALAYARLGYRVFPLQHGTKKGQLLKSWAKEATTDTERISRWWTKWPNANLGIACGAGLQVLDVDMHGKDGRAALLTKFGLDINELIPTTPCVQTARGGWQFYFEAPGSTSQKNSVNELAEGVDVRARGGYVVAPPSVFDDGAYRWLTPLTAFRAPWPAILRCVGEGERNVKLTSHVGYLYSLGLTDDEVADKARAWNAAHLDPPLSTREVETICASIAKKAAKQAAFDVQTQYSDIGNGARMATAVAHELKVNLPLNRWVAFNGRHWQWDTTAEPFARQLAKRFVHDEKRALLLSMTSDTPRKHADAIYKALKTLHNEGRLSAMVKNAKDDPIVRIDAKAFDRRPHLLNVVDGTLDLETFTLRPFDARDLLTGQLAVPYVAGARSDVWAQHIRYLASTGDGTPRHELEAFYWRALGYTLLGDNPERVLFFLKGRTTAGKSKLQEGARALFGDYAGSLNFYSLLKPAKARAAGGDQSRPDLVQLLGKRFVTAGEPNPDGEFDVALIKQLTGGDVLKFRTLYAEPIEFVFGGKLWLAANNPPKIEADDEAIWKRVLVLPVDYTIPDPLRNDNILAELTTPEALTGLLAMMVDGLKAWRAGGGLRPPKEVTTATVVYKDENDIVRRFLDERCVVNPDLAVKLSWVLDRLNEFCDEQGITRPCATAKQLKERLLDLVPGLAIQPGEGGTMKCRGLGFQTSSEGPGY